jgi:hypothetical protein
MFSDDKRLMQTYFYILNEILQADYEIIRFYAGFKLS